jgi:hypothetical protein
VVIVLWELYTCGTSVQVHQQDRLQTELEVAVQHNTCLCAATPVAAMYIGLKENTKGWKTSQQRER